jgi:hypothetical protein
MVYGAPMSKEQRTTKRSYHIVGPALLQEVAHVYAEAFRVGKPPTAAVQDMRPDVAYSTAARWVRQARQAGLLPPAVQGQPGWAEPTKREKGKGMIEVLTTKAKGVCANCGFPIEQTIGEWSPLTWHHGVNGRPECPGAPIAEPEPGSVRDVAE